MARDATQRSRRRNTTSAARVVPRRVRAAPGAERRRQKAERRVRVRRGFRAKDARLLQKTRGKGRPSKGGKGDRGRRRAVELKELDLLPPGGVHPADETADAICPRAPPAWCAGNGTVVRQAAQGPARAATIIAAASAPSRRRQEDTDGSAANIQRVTRGRQASPLLRPPRTQPPQKAAVKIRPRKGEGRLVGGSRGGRS